MESSLLFEALEEIDTVTEQDPSPDSDEIPSKKKRTRKAITKAERNRLINLVNGIPLSELAPCSLDKTNSILASHRISSVKEFGA